MTKRGLGRGFESLIPTGVVDESFDPTATEDEKVSELCEIKLTQIVRDETQPRKDFAEAALQDLAESIKLHGVLQPIVVMPLTGKQKGTYQVVAGERRWRAAKMAGLKSVPALVRTMNAQNRLELSIIENAQREDLNALELATAYAKLKAQFNLSDREIAERVGKSKTSVVNTMRLLDLPDVAKKAMVEYHLTEGVMRPLIKADEEIIKQALPKIIAEGWSARRVEQYVAQHTKKSAVRATKTHLHRREEAKLSEKYQVKVRITDRNVSFACKDEAELKKLLHKLA